MNTICKFLKFQEKMWFITAIIIVIIISFFIQNCTKEKIVIYGVQPGKVTLVSPPNSLSPLDSVPVFNWRPLRNAVEYQIQVATDIVFTSLFIDSTVSDTFYSHGEMFDNNTYYWRVRAKNSDNFWGDWSEATIWHFRMGEFPDDYVTLISPPDGLDSTYVEMPVLYWQSLTNAIEYQVNVANDVTFYDMVINTVVSDTFYYHSPGLDNGSYYWRVRAKDNNDIWGSWSEAMVWLFHVNNKTEFIELVTQIQTPGTAQDILVQNGVAYVADGQSDLTLIDVADPTNPAIIGNIDLYGDDFAKAVWKVPDDDYAYVADMDGKVQVLDVVNLESPFNYNYGLDQNLEELTGLYIDDVVDTVYIFTVSSLSRRRMQFYQFVYDEVIPRPGDMYAPNAIEFPADGNGVYFDSMSVFVEYYGDSTYYEQIMGKFIFAAVGEAGLWIINISDNHTFDNPDTTVKLIDEPRLVGFQDTPSISLSVQVKEGFAYVADDRGGLQIFNLPDTILAFDHKDPHLIDPVLIANLNTSGRTKDVHLVGNYCYLADGSKGLKIVDISDPYNPVFIAAYDTPYAYGLWADEDYVYVADRDNGIMIFENRVI
ncbi:MAG: hypothetical protein DRP26_01985 [Candidatus Zixiibacteriota bacterium]|nr:MAG: hypothetical protein DRP26_01985 [candidate division Zixibacteria bacterium]